MDDYDDLADPTLIQVEALCNLAEVYREASNKEVKTRLLEAMDLVILKLGPPKAKRASVIEVTERH